MTTLLKDRISKILKGKVKLNNQSRDSKITQENLSEKSLDNSCAVIDDSVTEEELNKIINSQN